MPYIYTETLSKYFDHGSVVKLVYIVELWESGDEWMHDRRIFDRKVDAARLFFLALCDGLNVRYIETISYAQPSFKASQSDI